MQKEVSNRAVKTGQPATRTRATAADIIGRKPNRADKCHSCRGAGYQTGVKDGAVFTCPDCDGSGKADR